AVLRTRARRASVGRNTIRACFSMLVRAHRWRRITTLAADERGADAVVGRPGIEAWDGLAAAPQLLLIEAFTAEAHVMRIRADLRDDERSVLPTLPHAWPGDRLRRVRAQSSISPGD